MRQASPAQIAELEECFKVRIVKPMRVGTFLKLMRHGQRIVDDAWQRKVARDKLYAQVAVYSAHDPRTCGHIDCRDA